MTREQFMEWLEAQGATPRNSVTKKTDLLIVGEDPGKTKIEDAKRKGIPTLHWYIMVQAGLTADRGEFKLKGIEPSDISALLIIMTSLVEDFYGSYLTGHEPSGRAFTWGLVAIESLLQATFGEEQGTDAD